MRILLNLLVAILTLLLAVTACAPAAAPAGLPGGAKATAIDPSISPTGTAVPSYETSLPAVRWGEGQQQHSLFPMDPSSGEALSGYEPISLGRTFNYAYSPDGRTLAAVTFPGDFPYYDGSLLLVDLANWKSQRFELELDGWAGALAFSPNGKQLAISHGNEYKSTLTIFDLEQGVTLTQEEIDLIMPRIKFTSGGDGLMLYGLPVKYGDTENQIGGGTPHALLLDAADLSLRWRAEAEGVREGIFPKDETSTLTPTEMLEQGQAIFLSPGVAFAPDHDRLYIAHADSEELTTVDFVAQTVETVAIHAQLTWFERLLSLTASLAHAKVADGTSKQVAVSPDGRLLYVVGVTSESYQDQAGNRQFSQTAFGLEIIQAADGSRVAHVETSSGELSLSPDGRFLYLRSWLNDGDASPGTEVFDTSSRQIVSRKANLALFPALRMDGELLLVSTHSLTETLHQMIVFQPEDLSPLAKWVDGNYITWLTP